MSGLAYERDLRPAQRAEAANAARRRCGEPSAAPAPEGEVRQHFAYQA
jgi:hypothetical protein